MSGFLRQSPAHAKYFNFYQTFQLLILIKLDKEDGFFIFKRFYIFNHLGKLKHGMSALTHIYIIIQLTCMQVVLELPSRFLQKIKVSMLANAVKTVDFTGVIQGD